MAILYMKWGTYTNHFHFPNMESEDIFENLTNRRIRREYEEAEECFDKAIELAPKHAQAYYNRAVLNAEMNNFNQAIDDCKNMLALNPELYEPNAFMGWYVEIIFVLRDKTIIGNYFTMKNWFDTCHLNCQKNFFVILNFIHTNDVY